MDKLLTVLLQVSAIGMLVSGIFTNALSKIVVAVVMLTLSPFVGKYLHAIIDPQIGRTDRRRAERRAKKAALKARQENREQIGFIYLKSTFQCAGYIAHADGQVCANEKALLDGICARLQLEPIQLQAASDYFYEAGNAEFDLNQTVDAFIQVCGDIEALCENFLQTQFSFIEASGRVTHAELTILKRISRRLNLQPVYESLLAEYEIQADELAEQAARQRIDALKRERDKRREAREKQRIEDAREEALKKLSPAQRKLYLAFAVLGIKPTKDKTIIKRAYREQIKRHHPDYLIAQGYPDELLQEAMDRSVKINDAYRTLKSHLKFI